MCARAANLPLPGPWLGNACPGLSAAHQDIAQVGGDAGSPVRTYLHLLKDKLHLVPQRGWGACAPGLLPTLPMVRCHLHLLARSLSFTSSHTDAEGPAKHQLTDGFALGCCWLPTLGQPRSWEVFVGCSLEDDRAPAQVRRLSLVVFAAPASNEEDNYKR